MLIPKNNHQYTSFIKNLLLKCLKTTISLSSNQWYNHLLFDCIGIFIKFETSHKPIDESIELIMFHIIENNHIDLINYALQILSSYVLTKKELNPNYQVTYYRLHRH